jgi:hypothetical protein
MDPAVAVLIGAGAGAGGALLSQFLNHGLSIKRDRRNQKRERLHLVVTEAAFALSRPTRDKRVPWEEWERQERHPESRAALNPHLVRDVEPFATQSSEGITLLQVHFGDDHWLIDKYISTCAVCLKAEEAWSEQTRRPDDQRIKEIPDIAKVMREAQEARNRWIEDARAEVEQI